MNPRPLEILCTKLFDIEEVSPGWKIADISVGPAHDPVVSMSRLRRKLGSGRRWRAGFLEGDGSGLRLVCLPDLVSLPVGVVKLWDIRPYVGNTWLYVLSELRQSSVRILDENGQQLRAFSIGGLPHIEVTNTGQIWAQYNDEGVFSGDEQASPGLCCFDRFGSPIYQHNHMIEDTYAHEDPEYETLFISDCSAMNLVSDEEVWAYFYTEFPLIRIVGHQIDRVWEDLPVKGSNGFAVGSGHVLFADSYHDRLLQLVDLASLRVAGLIPLDEEGTQIGSSNWTSVGQADTLYLVNEQTIYAVKVADAVSVVNA